MKVRKCHALLLVCMGLGLVSCRSNSEQSEFKYMNATELIAYNRSVDFWDQVYCVDEVRTGSHIRRRHCNTLLEIQTQVDRSASSVNVLSTSRVY